MTIKRRDLLTGGAGIAAGMAAAGLSGPAQAQSNAIKWDREADVVVIGSGASGTTAAIVAREGGSSVILVEAESHTGGHAICSGGNVPLGGGTSVQKKWGIKDLPDQVFQDLTDWSVVEFERRGRLPLERPRSDPRLRRQLRGDLRVSARPRRRVRRQGAG